MKVSKSAVFLFELMVIILVFTIAAAICTSIFAESFNMSKESKDLTMSSINAQTLAERFKAGEDNIDTQYFNKDWEAVGESEAAYTIKVDADTSSASMRAASVTVYREDESFFSITVKEFVG